MGCIMNKVNAIDLAEYIISHFSNISTNPIEGDLTNLKLQKLLYYIQTLYLKRYNTFLFDDVIEAWSYGPVIPSVYHKYKKFGRNVLDTDSPNMLLLDKEIKILVDEVIKDKGRYTGFALMEMTHNEKAWNLAMESYDKIITLEHMLYDISITR